MKKIVLFKNLFLSTVLGLVLPCTLMTESLFASHQVNEDQESPSLSHSQVLEGYMGNFKHFLSYNNQTTEEKMADVAPLRMAKNLFIGKDVTKDVPKAVDQLMAQVRKGNLFALSYLFDNKDNLPKNTDPLFDSHLDTYWKFFIKSADYLNKSSKSDLPKKVCNLAQSITHFTSAPTPEDGMKMNSETLHNCLRLAFGLFELAESSNRYTVLELGSVVIDFFKSVIVPTDLKLRYLNHSTLERSLRLINELGVHTFTSADKSNFIQSSADYLKEVNSIPYLKKNTEVIQLSDKFRNFPDTLVVEMLKPIQQGRIQQFQEDFVSNVLIIYIYKCYPLRYLSNADNYLKILDVVEEYRKAGKLAPQKLEFLSLLKIWSETSLKIFPKYSNLDQIQVSSWQKFISDSYRNVFDPGKSLLKLNASLFAITLQNIIENENLIFEESKLAMFRGIKEFTNEHELKIFALDLLHKYASETETNFHNKLVYLANIFLDGNDHPELRAYLPDDLQNKDLSTISSTLYRSLINNPKVDHDTKDQLLYLYGKYVEEGIFDRSPKGSKITEREKIVTAINLYKRSGLIEAKQRLYEIYALELVSEDILPPSFMVPIINELNKTPIGKALGYYKEYLDAETNWRKYSALLSVQKALEPNDQSYWLYDEATSEIEILGDSVTLPPENLLSNITVSEEQEVSDSKNNPQKTSRAKFGKSASSNFMSSIERARQTVAFEKTMFKEKFTEYKVDWTDAALKQYDELEEYEQGLADTRIQYIQKGEFSERAGFEVFEVYTSIGINKSEVLKEEKIASMRIDGEHRLVFAINNKDKQVRILRSKNHYDGKAKAKG